MSLIVRANISQRICAIAPSRAPDARAIFGNVTERAVSALLEGFHRR